LLNHLQASSGVGAVKHISGNDWRAVSGDILGGRVNGPNGSVFGQTKSGLLEEFGSLRIVGINIQDGSIIYLPEGLVSGHCGSTIYNLLLLILLRLEKYIQVQSKRRQDKEVDVLMGETTGLRQILL
jgi:hypothetical protein